MSKHRSQFELEAGLDEIGRAPDDAGELKLIVRRPAPGEREVLTEAALDIDNGLAGDNWLQRGSRHTDDGSAHPDMQLNIMNARVARLIAGSPERWPLAGDQLYIDMNLSDDNLPPGTRLSLGEAIIEVTAEPHLGCQKFKQRFGEAAMKFVNSDRGKILKLRGINAKIVRGGVIRSGDVARKLD